MTAAAAATAEEETEEGVTAAEAWAEARVAEAKVVGSAMAVVERVTVEVRVVVSADSEAVVSA